MSLNNRKKQIELSYPKMVAMGYFALIAIGTVLLMLPIASKDGVSFGFINSLFTATSATCVTGLVLRDTFTQWSLFGQLVILLLIQIGGLGFFTIIAMFSMLLGKKIDLRMRDALRESINTDNIGGIVRLFKDILIGTLVIEGIGAVILSLRFIPVMGVKEGIYSGIFHSISSFCNAGFDILGRLSPDSSLTLFATDGIVCITIALLVIIGGIGFFVWEDIKKNKLKYKNYRLHTKIVLCVSAALLIGGTIVFLLLEYNNSFAGYNFVQKLNLAFFCSVTPRTAGYYVVNPASLSQASKLLTIILMFIGGSSGSTAGGVKTSTIAVLFICMWSSLKNTRGNNIFNRRLEDNAVSRAVTVVTINMTLTLIAVLLISVFDSALPLTDILFEAFSAIGTVGLTTGITPSLNVFSRVVITVLMYLGRVGSLSFALLFFENKAPQPTQLPMGKINIG